MARGAAQFTWRALAHRQPDPGRGGAHPALRHLGQRHPMRWGALDPKRDKARRTFRNPSRLAAPWRSMVQAHLVSRPAPRRWPFRQQPRAMRRGFSAGLPLGLRSLRQDSKPDLERAPAQRPVDPLLGNGPGLLLVKNIQSQRQQICRTCRSASPLNQRPEGLRKRAPRAHRLVTQNAPRPSGAASVGSRGSGQGRSPRRSGSARYSAP